MQLNRAPDPPLGQARRAGKRPLPRQAHVLQTFDGRGHHVLGGVGQDEGLQREEHASRRPVGGGGRLAQGPGRVHAQVDDAGGADGRAALGGRRAKLAGTWGFLYVSKFSKVLAVFSFYPRLEAARTRDYGT